MPCRCQPTEPQLAHDDTSLRGRHIFIQLLLETFVRSILESALFCSDGGVETPCGHCPAGAAGVDGAANCSGTSVRGATGQKLLKWPLLVVRWVTLRE